MAIDFNSEPFFDDFDEDKKFLRVLFRPGFAVQTRELNQLQTILQKQISRFGDHVFKNGSMVIPGSVDISGDANFIRVDDDLANSDDSVYIGGTLENSAGITAKISAVSRPTQDDPLTLHFIYTTGGEFNQNESVTLTLIDGVTTETFQTENDPDYTGESTLITVNRGVFFINELFLLVETQTLVIDKYRGLSEIIEPISIGLFVDQNIITSDDDASLFDNAQGTFNESAPGAHRWQITPTLILETDVEDPESYTEIARIQNGEIARQVRESEFDVLGDSIAKRSFETNGSFVVKNFNLGIDEHPTDSDKLRVDLQPGKAFVRGFRVETLNTRRLDIDKARNTDSTENTLVPLQLGDFLHVKSVFSHPELFGQVKLYSDSTLSFTSDIPNEPSSLIGTANVRAVVFDPVQSALESETVIRLHLFNFDFESGFSIDDVKTVYSDNISPVFAAEISEASIENGDTILQNTTDEVALYELPFSNIDTITGSSFNFYKEFSTVVSAGSQVTITTPIASEQFRDEVTDYIVSVTAVNSGSTASETLGVIGNPDSVTLSVDNKTATLDLTSLGVNDTDAVTIHAIIFKSPGSIKTKSPVINSTLVVSTPTPTISLEVADVFDLVSITDANGVDYTRRYELDTGQRDTHYDIARLILRPGFTEPTEEVTITFSFFSHGGGDFFVADSYSSIAYENIPTYTADSGKEFPLANSIDFRPIINTSGEFFNTPVSFVPDSEAILDFDFFLAQRLKIGLTTNGNFVVSKSQPALDPAEPKNIDNGISLYDITLNPFTFDSKDLDARSINNPRYRMRDIGLLEDRIQDLEFFTSLNLLERDAISKEFIDKFKTGILVDPFFGHDVGDASQETYTIAIDPELGELRPECSIKSISLIDDETGSNFQVTGNVVTLPFQEVSLIEQNIATVLERIQPFLKYTWEGSMELNPSSDAWVSTRRVPDTTLDGGTRFSQAFLDNQNSLGTVWGGWRTVWRPIRDGHGGFDTTFRTGIRTVRTERTEIERLGDRVVDRSVIPFIRSRNVEFSAIGLRPLTEVTPYFDDIDVAAFVTPAGGSQGDQLVTNAIGSVSGTFEIPNQDDIRFRTGLREFELRDKEELPRTDAVATYSAQGILEDISTFFLSTTVVGIDRRSVSRVASRTYYDPVAQSFAMPLREGGFITSVDIFLGPDAANNTFPVIVQIRNMVNGLPGDEIVSTVTRPADELSGSEDGTVSTRFTFDRPVYLEEDEEYCFVVLTDSETLTIWKAVMGQADVITGQQMTRQPFLGSLFKSQNNRTWTPAQLETLKFQINRAEFNTAVQGQVTFTNEVSSNDTGTEADPHIDLLPLDPFTFTNGSTVIRVDHPNHSMEVGDTVQFSAENSSALAGVPEGELFDIDLTVSEGPSSEDIGMDFYFVNVDTEATENNQLGGGAVFGTQHVGFSVFYPIVETLELDGTTVNWQFKGTSKFGKVADTGFRSMNIENDNILTFPRTVTESGDGSVSVRATLSSTRDNISPYIDVKRFALIATENRVNNIEDENNNPESDNALARYLTKPVELINPANEITVFFDANRPPGTTIDVYHKVKSVGSGTRFSDQNWVKFEGGSIPTSNENLNTFSEYSFNHEFAEDFNIHAIKIVLRSSNEARVPRLRGLRVIAIKG